MKKLITSASILLCLLSFSARAQYVAIPDSSFCHWLKSNGYAACMSQDNLDTTCTAVTSATKVVITSSTIKNLYGIQFFKNLTNLDCHDNLLTSLPSLPPLLTTFKCDSNLLTSLPVLPSNLITLNCLRNKLTSLPVLPNTLTTIYCTYNHLTTLPSLPGSILTLSCGYNQLTSLPVLPNTLNTLVCDSNNLTSLPVLPTALRDLECKYNQLTTLPATLPNSITSIFCTGNQLTSLPALPTSLNGIDCSSNLLTTLPALPLNILLVECDFNKLDSLPALPSGLLSLYCTYNKIKSLPALPSSLTVLNCGLNVLTSLPVLPSTLSVLWCNSNQITSLPALPSTLTQLFCQSNLLQSLPAMPGAISTLQCGANVKLFCLPELPAQMTELNYDGSGITCLPNRVTVSNTSGSSSTIYTLPLCSNLISGCPIYWNISGDVHADIAANCTQDSLNPGTGCANMKAQLWKNNILQQQMIVTGLGQYSFDTDDNDTFSVTIDTAALPLNIVCPVTQVHDVIVTPQDSLLYNINFGVQCKGVDLGVYNICGRFRTAHYSVVNIQAGDLSQLYNMQCANGTRGTVTTMLSGPVKYIQPAAGALFPSTVSGNTLTYTINDFGAADFRNAFSIIVETDTTAPIGSQVCITTQVTTSVIDINPGNNTLTECFNVVNSHDPNVKSVYPTGTIFPAEWLTYTINFQNTGTDTAYYVIVRDTLNNNLDAATFTYLESSNNVVTQVKGNVVTFTFAHINLPDSLQNEPASHAWVQYKIRPKQNLPAKTSITNKASIYFDLNTPVVTNTTTNTIAGLSVSDVKPTNTTFKLYPNPATNYVTIDISQPAQMNIVNILGEAVYTQNIHAGKTNINTTNLPAGVYSVMLKTTDGSIVNKKLVVAH